MRVHLQVRLCLLDEYLHFILIQTLVAAELQLGCTFLKVITNDSMTGLSAPVTSFGALESRTPTLGKAGLRTKSNTRIGGSVGLILLTDWPVAPVAVAPG